MGHDEQKGGKAGARVTQDSSEKNELACHPGLVHFSLNFMKQSRDCAFFSARVLSFRTRNPRIRTPEAASHECSDRARIG